MSTTVTERSAFQRPTREQKAKAIAVVEREAKLLRQEYAEPCENPGHCALGALLSAAGMSDGELLDLGFSTPRSWGAWSPATKLLAQEYGLTQDHAQRLMYANDEAKNRNSPKRRRETVLEFLRSLPTSDDGPGVPSTGTGNE